MLKFYHLKIVSGAVDVRKWSAKWKNWNISDIFFSLSSKEGRKQWRPPETFAPCMGTILPCESTRQENGFLVRFKDNRFDISDTSCSERPSGLDDHFNISSHLISLSKFNLPL